MKIKTRIEIMVDADIDQIGWVKSEIRRYLCKIEDLYEEFGIFNVKVTPLALETAKLEWLETND